MSSDQSLARTELRRSFGREDLVVGVPVEFGARFAEGALGSFVGKHVSAVGILDPSQAR